MRSTATQIWPALANAPCAACSAAHAGSTPASTIRASLPPFSSSALAPRAAHACAMARPVALLPTWATTSTSSAAANRAPTGPSPSMISSTPAGSAAATSSAKRRPVRGQRSLGLCTTVLPVTSAAPISPAATATGSFHGVSTATTPRGCGTIRSVADEPPSRLRAPVDRTQFRVLPQGPDAGLHAAQGIVEWLARLLLVEPRQFLGCCGHRVGGRRSPRRHARRPGCAPRPRRPTRARATAPSQSASSAMGTRATVSPFLGSRTVISKVCTRGEYPPSAVRHADSVLD